MRPIALLAAVTLFPASLGAVEPVSFSRDILPLLADNCFHCHGPDAKSREADLRLDTQSGALRRTDPVIVPGDGAGSLLVRLLSSDDDEQRMPPPKTNRRLTPQQIALVRRWIDEGAVWGKHWAFETPRRPAVPALRDANSPSRNPIDAFVRARLDGRRLAPEASRETLIRRVTLDLTGLPPTPEEVDAFLADRSPLAYETVVDRLLRSPRYGERMVWEWLDAARYADTNGYQGDPTRTMHFWRDWVVQAMNQNMPFDQFTVEQLAGDLLPDATQDQRIASGFHRNHMINGEGGRIAEESRVDYVQDRVETTGAVWMGLTLNCCRCHDHKFDPLSQREYYQLSAYFNSIDESGGNDAGGLANPVLSLASPEQTARIETLRAAEQAANRRRDDVEKQLPERQAAWEKSLAAPAAPSQPSGETKPVKTDEPIWTPLVPNAVKSEQGAELVVLPDGGVLARGPKPAKDVYTATVRTKLAALAALRLEALPHDSLTNRGPGRADNGNFVLSELRVRADGRPLKLVAVKADFAQTGFALAGAVDSRPETGWAVMPRFGQPLQAIFQVTPPPERPGAAAGAADPAREVELEFELAFQFGREHTLGHFRLYAASTPVASPTQQPSAPSSAGPPADVLTIVAQSVERRSEADRKKLADYFRDNDAELAAAKKAAEDAKKSRESGERASPRTMVMRDRAQPRDTFILARGAYDKPGEKVSHGVPAILPPLPADAAPNRLSLARWLVSLDHPLTARVTVNRYWQMFFGVGLVKTAEDFGVQGERPSHAELLDWLACEFQRPSVPQPSVAHASPVDGSPSNGWNVKHLHRLIVTSATYRQSSSWRTANVVVAAEDPENRLLARGPRFRMPSWMLRDQALAASGLLVERLGGPPVKGYQPPGIWEEATFGRIKYQQDNGEALYRRSLYLFWRRIVGPTVFFDVANRQTCQVKLTRTNTPLHALVTLNDVTYVEAARALAERVLRESPAVDPSDEVRRRIERMTRLVLARPPSERERQVFVAALQRLRGEFAAEPDAAKRLIGVGDSKASPDLEPAELAAYAALAGAVLNLDESLTKE